MTIGTFHAAPDWAKKATAMARRTARVISLGAIIFWAAAVQREQF